MMIVWWVFLILLITVAVKALINSNSKPSVSDSESPIDILKRRYANGEIDKEEFEEKKKDLLS